MLKIPILSLMDQNAAKKQDDMIQEWATGSQAKSAQKLLSREYDIEVSDNPDSFVSAIMSYVMQGNYDRAINEMKAYQNSKKDYPQFSSKTQRHFEYAADLVNAIKTKKNFPHVAQLPANQRKEINIKIHNHFHELKAALDKVIKIEYEMRLRDARSTIWVVQAVIIAFFILAIVGFSVEASRSMHAPFNVLINDISKIFYKLFGI